MSNKENDKEIKEVLQQALAPLKNSELRRDLWPQMLRKLDEQPSRVPWFDWALAGILGAALFLFPGAIPALLYHL
jgi:hypothetical protein